MTPSPESGGKSFTMTEHHLKLLRNANVVWWCAEWGAPCIDPKRPYGNGDMLFDIATLLGELDRTCPHCHEFLNDTDSERHQKLHTETQTALQIVLRTGEFVPGTYVASKYDTDWRRIL